MTRTFDRTFQQLEGQKSEVVAALASLSPARLHFHPAPGSWSALEVLDHLQRVEHGILNAIVETMPDPHRRAFGDRVRSKLLRGLFAMPARVKAPPSAPQIMPGDDLDFAAIAERWAGTRLRLADLLANFPPPLEHLGVFRHPVSGWMTMNETLSFFSVHIKHHNYQLRRLERSHARRPAEAVSDAS